jgi:hypothetical protein
MHTRRYSMDDRIIVNSRYFWPAFVHISEKSWLMGELLFTSEITILILPSRILELVKKIPKNKKNVENWNWKKWWCALVFAIPVLLLVLLLAVLLSIVVLAFIATSIVMDILWMLGKLCQWMKCKQCNSATSRPQVGFRYYNLSLSIKQTPLTLFVKQHGWSKKIYDTL